MDAYLLLAGQPVQNLLEIPRIQGTGDGIRGGVDVIGLNPLVEVL